MKKFFLPFFLALIGGVSFAAEHYGIPWSEDHVKSLRSYGYNEKDASKIMYESNDSCSKKIEFIQHRFITQYGEYLRLR